jgi:hypothetical protein
MGPRHLYCAQGVIYFRMPFSSSSRIALVIGVVTLFAGAATAQEKTVGLVVGYPADVGVLWQTAERVALRADLGFNLSGFESSSAFGFTSASLTPSMVTTTSKTATATFGLSALVTLRNQDNLRLYLAPGGAIQLVRHSVETEFEGGSLPAATFPAEGEASDTTRGHQFQLMFGGQYRLRDRVAIFGETGLVYQTSSFPQIGTSLSIGGATTRAERDSRSTNVGVRGLAGLVLFF